MKFVRFLYEYSSGDGLYEERVYRRTEQDVEETHLCIDRGVSTEGSSEILPWGGGGISVSMCKK